MKRCFTVGVSLAGAAILAASPAQSAASSAEAEAEVTAAAYASAETIAAYRRQTDATLTAQRARIDALQRQVKAGAINLQTKLTKQKAGFMAELSGRDRDYARAIEILRVQITDIAATPEGLAALQRFNNGDEKGALADLDAIAAKHVSARAGSISDDRYRIADLADDAYQRGKIGSAELIVRWTELTRVAPDQLRGWVRLSQLYRDAGRLDEALAAIERASQVAGDDVERVSAQSERVNVLLARGAVREAQRVASDNAVAARRVAAARPGDPVVQSVLIAALGQYGATLSDAGDVAGAERALVESIGAEKAFAARHPEDPSLPVNIAKKLVNLALDQVAGVRLDEARATLAEAAAICRPIVKASGSVDAKQVLGTIRMEVAVIDDATNRPDEAIAGYRDALAQFDVLLHVRPDSVELQTDRANAARWLGEALYRRHDYAGAVVAQRTRVESLRANVLATPRSVVATATLAFAEAQLGDYATALGDDATQREAFAAARPLFDRLRPYDPKDQGALRGYWYSTIRLFMLGDPQVTAADTVEALVAGQHAGQLGAREEKMLADLRAAIAGTAK